MKNIYLNKYVLSVNQVNNLLTTLFKNVPINFNLKKEHVAITNFSYNIDCYTIGSGKNHVVLLGATHGTEVVTTHFILEFLISLINEDKINPYILQNYTFHIIPILNIEGYHISTSCTIPNLGSQSKRDIEEISRKYLKLYNADDEISKKGIIANKMYKTVLSCSSLNIDNYPLEHSVLQIIRRCKLDTSTLPVWSANGVGIDPNSNSIHEFKNMVKLRKQQKCGNLRYNDIPVTIPSPMSYPGRSPLDPLCPETRGLHAYIQNLYNLANTTKDEKLIAIFSYHSTGAEIYGYPNEYLCSKSQLDLHLEGMKKYSEITGYTQVNENLKYGVMDYYRAYLKDVLTLTIELSAINANPIGPFSNINSLNREILSNKGAILKTLDFISKKIDKQ